LKSIDDDLVLDLPHLLERHAKIVECQLLFDILNT
jgi:hypothetical protein